jgi:hypothetical protein
MLPLALREIITRFRYRTQKIQKDVLIHGAVITRNWGSNLGFLADELNPFK